MRITGGELRSRPLAAPRGDTTRPTSDRVREALFDIVTAKSLAGTWQMQDADVLDLYAGSGALGFEALSRGARSATLVEQNRAALAVIRENATGLDLLKRVEILACSVESGIQRLAGRSFGFVTMDPPYDYIGDGRAARALRAAAALLAPGGLLVLEHRAKDAPPPVAELETSETRRYGDTSLTFYTHRDQ